MRMEEQYLYGPSGKYIKVQALDNLYLPLSPINRSKQFEELKKLSARDSDVLLCAYPKSGLHWIWEIVRMLMFGTTELSPYLLESSMIELQTKENLDKKKSPHILASHLKYRQLPPSFRERKTKIIYILRDPRAIAVSYFHHIVKLKHPSTNLTENDWREYLDMFINGKVMFGSWFDAVKDWEREINQHREHSVHVIYYENFKQDTLREVQKLAKFLNADSSVEFCANITRNTQLQNMKTLKENAVKKNYVKAFFKDGDYPFYRKGTTDDWKNAFTVDQNEQFEEHFLRQMKGSSVRLKSML